VAEDEQTDSASAPAGPRFGQTPPPPPIIPSGAGGERPEAEDSEDHKTSVAVDVGPDPDKTSVSITVDFDGDGTTSVDRGAGSETVPTPASAGFEREAGVDTTAAGSGAPAGPAADPINQKAHAPTPEGIARTIDRGPQDATPDDKGSVAAEIDDDFGTGLPAAGVRGVRTVNDLDGDTDFGAGAGGDDDGAGGDADAMDRKPAADVVSAGLEPADSDLGSDAADLDAGEDAESFELPEDDLGAYDADAHDVPALDDLDHDKVEDLGGYHL
jgi:hypothetical protein